MNEEDIQQEEQQQETVEQPQVEPETLRGRALFEKNIRAKYGDDIDEDEMYDKIMQSYDEDRTFNKNARRDREEIAKYFEDPRWRGFMESIAAGRSVSEAKQEIPDDLPDADAEGFKKAEELRKERENGVVASMEKLNENLNKSNETIRKFISENNIPEDEAKELLQKFTDVFGKPLSEGMITEDMLNVAAKGFLYDQHKTKWEEAGRVAGRNDKIEENRKRFEGDGTVKTNPSSSPMREGNADNERVREAAYFKEIADRQRQHPFLH